tara:strand:+ start:858 stop:2264 length:1407 start_codon:yes stop_codon:yes gene_type:complete
MKILILGGGAAGWFTALYCNKYFYGHDVTLIESDKIGILGAGEGTTPGIIESLRFLDIDPLDLIKKTGGTFKNGISFKNWNGDNTQYFHPFTGDETSYLLHEALNKNANIDNFLYANKISYANRIDPNNCTYALHFDAHRIAKYLKSIAIGRGVKRIEGEYKKAIGKNKIKSIVLTDNRKFDCDFIFDCSGFARLLVGKHFNTPWVSYQKHLPMKRAVPFKLKHDKDLIPYTEAVAMKYGWVWKIPLQERWGSGYIYDSDYINEDQAIAEASRYFKQDLKPLRPSFKFDAGRHEKVWVSNCLAVGLSTGFTEPLEATSIWLALSSLQLLQHFLSDIKTLNQGSLNKYNEIVAENNDNILSFLYLHYMTKRKDSLFWKNFRKNTVMPAKLKPIIKKIEDGSFTIPDLLSQKGNLYFTYIGHIVVSHALGLIKKKKDMTFYNPFPSMKDYMDTNKINFKQSIKHSDFFEM